jgi:CheY-like chemotaxis protein
VTNKSIISIATDAAMQTALYELFALADITPPNQIHGNDIAEVISKLKTQLKKDILDTPFPESTNNDNPFAAMAAIVGDDTMPKLPGKPYVLIVGQLGIVMYQLKVALTKTGMDVMIVKGMNEALHEYPKHEFSTVLIDLFMPTEREGLMVLMEMRRYEKEKRIPSTFMVIANVTDREKIPDMERLCLKQGAHVFLPKLEGWHQRVIDFLVEQSKKTAV